MEYKLLCTNCNSKLIDVEELEDKWYLGKDGRTRKKAKINISCICANCNHIWEQELSTKNIRRTSKLNMLTTTIDLRDFDEVSIVKSENRGNNSYVKVEFFTKNETPKYYATFFKQLALNVINDEGVYLSKVYNAEIGYNKDNWGKWQMHLFINPELNQEVE